jgi:hypothetical protein
MVDPTKLGALKLEGIFDKALFLAPKVYALQNESETIIKIKGLKRNVLEKSSLEKLLPGLRSKQLKKGETLKFNQIKWVKY